MKTLPTLAALAIFGYALSIATPAVADNKVFAQSTLPAATEVKPKLDPQVRHRRVAGKMDT
jgi:hypothetical protein